MKAKILIPFIVVLLAIHVACEDDTEPPSVFPNTTLSKDSIFFKGFYDIYPMLEEVGDTIKVRITGQGKAALLDVSTIYSESQVDRTVYPFRQWGTLILTGSHGDQLIGSLEGKRTRDDFAELWGNYQITEGTGQFSGVTGTGTFSGHSSKSEGWITFTGKLKNP